MNLAWIVAVLRPLDIAPHPNFRNPEYDAAPYAQLAGIVSGDPSRWSHYSMEEAEGSVSIDQGVRSAEMSLTNQGIRVGLDGLVEEIQSEESIDLARSCALGLLACCAAAELDEYEKCRRILEGLLGKTTVETPEGKLVRASLLQQQCLRFRDSGRDHISQTTEILSLLDEIEDSDFSEFPMSPGASVSYTESLRHVITALRHAAWSLVPMRLVVDGADELPPSLPTWQQLVRTPKSNQASKIDQLRASEYSKFVEASFNRMFRSQTRTIGGRGAPTLFHAALNYELLGDVAVYRLRKEHALMKLVQCMSAARPDSDEVADALRLLRHANLKSEIDLAVERIRASGPLAALAKDSTQILKNRTEPRMLRASELRVLRGAADLMTQSDARNALSLTCRVIEAGGAQPAPGSSQLDVVRLESAWLTATRLANIAEEDDEIALLLLQAAQDEHQGDELWDKAVGRSLRNLNWENVSPQTKSRWNDFFRSNSSRMAASRSVFEALTSGHTLPEHAVLEDLEDVANRVNAAMGGAAMSDTEASASVEIVTQALASIRSEASRGRFSFRALDPADVAAALIIYADATMLWPTLSEFLVDQRVQRADKSGAFDRLSYSSAEVPPEVAEVFRLKSAALLQSQGGPFDGDVVVPFPAALRFLASRRMIGEPETFSLISQMSGSGEAESREEASRTVATLASSIASPWLLAQAMQFSHDSEPAVRGHAARALSFFAATQSEFRESAEYRLVEMMGDEGILVPLLVIRQMSQNRSVPDSVKEAIGVLVANHPSLTVRREAAALLTEIR
ncbi:hypothetical protein H0H10_38410 [Streptomyces sp. TRM S81-3]|uniref:Uncharacterized protein n=1 Tax=Streptomyces griseicoloratus TaxID=2752516 RepID=A0A926LBC3_9ACTN|nr:hypothetical protein [Streptomyces griseicoloratus]MBD0424981.1 hypothetical protein [Streptomyces griseicoloratus]